ncbi:MAG: trimeric intracellular cation channel family protein [Bacteroidaceae bacterium]|nr:trimeric intracellular cation channel family protein [Bacteroidaceae bacterium]
MNITFVDIIEFIGTFAFAISGIRLASAKQFDLFGAYVVGLVTAIGGGTIRDLLIGITPFWMTDPIYLIITAFSLVWVMAFRKYLVKMNNTIFLFDAIGLALFAVVGIQKTLDAGFPLWVATIMGTMTGAAGGVLRDVFINEVPLIFRKDIYAMACVMGGFAYWVCSLIGCDSIVTQITCGICVFLTRVLAVRFHISLPILKGEENN